MMAACRQFLTDRLLEVVKADGNPAFPEASIFFGPMPRDFLRSNQFAACCLMHQDEKEKDGRLMANIRNEACTEYTRIIRAFKRQLLFRVILFSADFKDQWGEAEFKGFIDQLEEKAGRFRVIPDDLNMAVRIDLYDSIRPWNHEEAEQRLKRSPHKAIARIMFTGGVYKQQTVPIIQDVDLQPSHE